MLLLNMAIIMVGLVPYVMSQDVDCSAFNEDMVCDMDDMNIIDTKHNLTVRACQVFCADTIDCSWFTWYSSKTTSVCWLLKDCDMFESCAGCISGPATGPNVDDCTDSASTANPGNSTTTITTTTSSMNGTTTMGPTTTATTTQDMTTTNDVCDVFKKAACDIDDMNTVDVRHDLTVGMCQSSCSTNPDCKWFTWYPSLGQLGICWLLEHCEGDEVCPYCVSGPADGVDVDDCSEFSATTTTEATTTVTGTSSEGTTTTSEVTTTADGCDMYSCTSCDIDESNNLDMMHDITVGMCQDICAGNPDCNWFTWNNVYGLYGTCWLLDHCNSQEACPDCISGPAVGADVDSCYISGCNGQ